MVWLPVGSANLAAVGMAAKNGADRSFDSIHEVGLMQNGDRILPFGSPVVGLTAHGVVKAPNANIADRERIVDQQSDTRLQDRISDRRRPVVRVVVVSEDGENRNIGAQRRERPPDPLVDVEGRGIEIAANKDRVGALGERELEGAASSGGIRIGSQMEVAEERGAKWRGIPMRAPNRATFHNKPIPLGKREPETRRRETRRTPKELLSRQPGRWSFTGMIVCHGASGRGRGLHRIAHGTATP